MQDAASSRAIKGLGPKSNYQSAHAPVLLSTIPFGLTAHAPVLLAAIPFGLSAHAPVLLSTIPFGLTAHAPVLLSTIPFGLTAHAPVMLSRRFDLFASFSRAQTRGKAQHAADHGTRGHGDAYENVRFENYK